MKYDFFEKLFLCLAAMIIVCCVLTLTVYVYLEIAQTVADSQDRARWEQFKELNHCQWSPSTDPSSSADMWTCDGGSIYYR